MSAIRSQIATRMTETSGCATTSPRTTVDDQQVVMGRSGRAASSANGFCGVADVTALRPITRSGISSRLTTAFVPANFPMQRPVRRRARLCVAAQMSSRYVPRVNDEQSVRAVCEGLSLNCCTPWAVSACWDPSTKTHSVSPRVSRRQS
jgi:hypothetical protein